MRYSFFVRPLFVREPGPGRFASLASLASLASALLSALLRSETSQMSAPPGEAWRAVASRENRMDVFAAAETRE